MASGSTPEPIRKVLTSERLPGAGRVLVLEDESVIRDTIEMLISIEGCDARGVPDGPAALALLRDWTPDLILVDYTLPGMTGQQFIHAYHQSPEPHAPIILLTARDITGAEATAMGAMGVLSKPFDVTDLLDVVAGFTHCGDDD